MKKANIGHWSRRTHGTESLQESVLAHHTGVTLLSLEGEEAEPVKRGSGGWPCCHADRKVRSRGLK